jgi:hypothetical protein
LFEFDVHCLFLCIQTAMIWSGFSRSLFSAGAAGW